MAGDVGDAVRFRQGVALRSDSDFVASTFSDPDYSADLWGVPLTSAEERELARRQDIQLAIPPVIEWALKQDGYGGVFLDHDRGGIPVFEWTDSLDTRREQLASRMPEGVDFDVRRVDRTLEQLRTKANRITADADQLAEGGVHITLVAVMQASNSVRVGVAEASERVRAALADHGDWITVAEEGLAVNDACVGVENCPPGKAGIQVEWRDSGGDDHFCTSGAMGRRFIVDGPDLPVITTAGHCLEFDNAANRTWYHVANSQPIGPELTHVWETGGNTDIGIIKVTDEDFDPDAYNKIFVDDANALSDRVTSLINRSAMAENSTVCRMGARSKKDCGIISPTMSAVDPARTRRTTTASGSIPRSRWHSTRVPATAAV